MIRDMRKAVLSLLLATAALGCGGAKAAGEDREIRLQTQVILVRGDSRERLGVAPEQARIRASADSLERALGRAVAIEVDAALTPQSASGLDAQTADSIEGLARYVTALRRDDLAFEFVRRTLSRVVARYRASAEWPSAEYDESSGTMTFTMRETHGGSFLPPPIEVDRAIDQALARDLGRRFSSKRPASIAEPEQAAFLRWVTETRHGKESDADRASRIDLLLQLEASARGKAISAKVEEALAREIEFVTAPERRAASFAPLRARYARFIAERFFAIDHETRSRLYEKLLAGPQEAQCPQDPCIALPELDRTKLALAFFTTRAPSDERDFDAFDQALCLHTVKGETVERNRSCRDVYTFFLASPARADRLVDTLVATKNRDFLVAALVSSGPRAPALFAALERRGGALYEEAMRIVLDLDHYRLRDMRHGLSYEVTRVWPKRPDLRPVLLRASVQDWASSGRSDEAFEKLGRELGGIDAVLFARFLDLGPRSVELAPKMWPALKDVATPFEIVAARLDRYIDKRGLEASTTIAALVRRACDARDLEGLRVMRNVIEKRVKAGDKDAVALALTVRDCRAPKP